MTGTTARFSLRKHKSQCASIRSPRKFATQRILYCLLYHIVDDPVHRRDSAYGARGEHNACKGVWARAAISKRALRIVAADGVEAVDVDHWMTDEGLGGAAEGTDSFDQGAKVTGV
jgi:hypothetical protein